MPSLAERLGIDPTLHDLWGQLDEDTQAATALVFVCWAGHGIDLGRDRRLAMRWWGEFIPARVALCAMTSSSIGEFTAALTQRLRGQVGGQEEEGKRHREAWRELLVLPAERQRKILDILERQASVCATIVRAHADTKRKVKPDGATTTKPDSQSAGDAGPGLFNGTTGPGDVPTDAGAGITAEPAL